MNHEIRAGIKPEINKDGWITGVILGVNTDTNEFVAECEFEYNPKTDELSLHKYSEPGRFTGASYELEIPEFFKEHIQETVNAFYMALDDYCNENIQYWYANKYPLETQVINDMNHEAEFSSLKEVVVSGDNVDDYLGIKNGEFRGRVLEELSKRSGISLERMHESQHDKNISEPERMYRIFQLKGGEENRDYRFESLDRLHKRGLQLDPERYKEVYKGVMKPDEGLEDIYQTFNVNHPKDFRGHSMSVSDVVVISGNGSDHAFFCDNIGFTEVPGFVQGLKIETPSSDLIKDWYMASFPDDEVGQGINPEATFDGLREALAHADDVYEYLGVGDSVVRERAFAGLAEYDGVDYDTIYDAWLYHDGDELG